MRHIAHIEIEYSNTLISSSTSSLSTNKVRD